MPSEKDCCSESLPGRPCSCSACKVHGHGDHDRMNYELMAEAQAYANREARKYQKCNSHMVTDCPVCQDDSWGPACTCHPGAKQCPTVERGER